MSAADKRGLVLACITTATFTDMVAYTVAVPVLPDYATRFNASPTTVGLLFGSFGVAMLTLSIPMGALSDRAGRRWPMIGALALLVASTLLFATATTLPTLFAARILQGAGDAMTWVVGFALITDLYPEAERGRAMGLAMAGSTLGIIAGPLLGGWLYELGGIRLPFLVVAGLAAADLVLFAIVTPETPRRVSTSAPLRRVFALRSIRICACLVIAAAASAAMLEPVLPLWFESRLGLGPASIGTLFGLAAVASSVMHPSYGRLSDKWGGRPLMIAGLVSFAAILPLLNLVSDFRSAAIVMIPLWMTFGLFATPSLTYFAQVASEAGLQAYGVVYGVYNVAWAVGLMIGSPLAGYLYERFGFAELTITWSVLLVAVSLVFSRVR